MFRVLGLDASVAFAIVSVLGFDASAALNIGSVLGFDASAAYIVFGGVRSVYDRLRTGF